MLTLDEIAFNKDDPQIRDELVRMIIQYLGDIGYTVSMKTLADEHNLKEKQGVYSKRHMAQMRAAILDGEWGLVDKLIAKPVFKGHPQFIYALFKQRYKELLEAGEQQKAYELINQRLKPLEAHQAFPNEIKDLCYGLISNPQEGLRDFDRVRSRHKLIESFSYILVEDNPRTTLPSTAPHIPSDRLLQLLHQACAYQVAMQKPTNKPSIINSLLHDYEADVSISQCVSILKGHSSNVKCVEFMNNGKLLASGSSDHTIRIWDISQNDHTTKAILHGHKARIWCLASSPTSSNILTSVSGDGTVKLWDYSNTSDPCLATLSGHSGDVYYVAYHTTGTRIGTAGYDKTSRLWDVETMREVSCFYAHNSPVTCVSFNSYGNLIISGGKDGLIRFCDVTYGVETMSLASPTGSEVSSFSLDHTGLYALVSYRDSSIRLWGIKN